MDFRSHANPEVWVCADHVLHARIALDADGQRLVDTWPCDRGSCCGIRVFPGTNNPEPPVSTMQIDAAVQSALERERAKFSRPPRK